MLEFLAELPPDYDTPVFDGASNRIIETAEGAALVAVAYLRAHLPLGRIGGAR